MLIAIFGVILVHLYYEFSAFIPRHADYEDIGPHNAIAGCRLSISLLESHIVVINTTLCRCSTTLNFIARQTVVGQLLLIKAHSPMIDIADSKSTFRCTKLASPASFATTNARQIQRHKFLHRQAPLYGQVGMQQGCGCRWSSHLPLHALTERDNRGRR